MQLLSDQPQTVDFAAYRSQLKNQAVIDQIETEFKNFKPVSYDVGRQLKAIEAFEAQAVKNAQETKGVVDRELQDLEATLKNIEEARPFHDLTVVCLSFGFWFFQISGAMVMVIGSRLTRLNRMRLRRQDRILTNARLSSCRKGAGKYRDIRSVLRLML